jgi:hypothetical protein
MSAELQKLQDCFAAQYPDLWDALQLFDISFEEYLRAVYVLQPVVLDRAKEADANVTPA